MPTTSLLVMDAHPLVRRGVVALLEGEPWAGPVFEAGSIAQGREAAEAHRPDLIVLDVALPDGDGVSAIPRLRADSVVVVFTDADDPQRVRAALEAGASGYVLKDSEPETLISALRVAAAGGRILGPGVQAAALPGSQRRGPADVLTPRERQLLSLLAQGRSNHEIARALSIREKTVRNQVSIISTKLGVAGRVQAALFAHNHGVVVHDGRGERARRLR